MSDPLEPPSKDPDETKPVAAGVNPHEDVVTGGDPSDPARVDTRGQGTDPTPSTKKKKRTWAQRFKLLVLVLLIGACVFRIALNILLPTVINRVAGMYGLECGYDRLGLSLLGGHANLYGLKLRPAGGGESLMQADFIEGDLSVLELFRGNLIVFRAEVDGVVVAIDREADGSIPILQKFMAAKAATPQSTPAATSQPASPYNLNPPLRVDAIRLSHVRARIRDKSVTPTFEATVATTLRVSDVGRTDGPTKFELDVGVEPLLDTLRVAGTAATTADSLKADVAVLVRGLHPKRAAAYLRPFGLVPLADDMTVKADLSVDAKTIPNSADVTAVIHASNITAVADGAEWASLESFTLDAKRLSAAAVELTKLTLTNGTATAHRNREGGIEAAGFRLAPVEAAAATTQPATRPAPTAVAVTPRPNATQAGAPPFRFSLGELDARQLTVTVTDAGVSPAATLVARLSALSVRNIDTASDKPIPLAADVSLPGILRRVTVMGQVSPLAATRTVTLKVAGEGLRPDAVRSYLTPLGIQSLLNDAHFAADLEAGVTQAADGTITADAGVANVKLADGDQSLIELAAAKITGLSFTPTTGAIVVTDINLSGPSLTVTRDADERISAAGFKLVGATPSDSRVPAAPPAYPGGELGTASANAANAATASATVPVDTRTQSPLPATQPALPRIELGHLKWADLRLTLDDKATPGAEPFVLNNVGVDLTNLLLDLSAPDAGGRPGVFTAYVAAPGLADIFTVTGTFTPKPNQLITTIDVSGRGLTGERIAAYVRPFGIEPTLKSARLEAHLAATVTQTPDGRITADLQAQDVTYADGDTELAGIDFVRLANLRVTPKRIDLDEVTATKPRARVARLADGTLQGGGIHLIAATRPASTASAEGPTATVTPVAAGVNPREAATNPATGPNAARVDTRGQAAASGSPPLLAPLPIELGLKKLRVEGAALELTDAAAPGGTPVTLRTTADVSLDNLTVVPDAAPAAVKARVGIDGVVELNVDGTVTPSPVAPAAALTINASRVNAGPITAYLPPTIEPLFTDGQFSASIRMNAANAPDGGLSAALDVKDLSWFDRASGPAGEFAVAVPAVSFVAPRLDAAAGEFDIDVLAVNGIYATVRQTPQGLQAAGVRLRQPPPVAPTMSATAPALTAASTPSAVKSVADMVADARRPLPRLSLNRLAIGLQRVALNGLAGDPAGGVVVSNLQVTSPRPIRFGGPEAEAEPPLDIRIGGRLDASRLVAAEPSGDPVNRLQPLVGRFDAALQATPFANEPAVQLGLTATGLNGNGLTTLLPNLAQTLDGRELKDGTFNAHVDARVNYGRRGPRDFDLGRGFTASFEVKPVELRQTKGGPVIAGLKGIRGDNIKVSPASGDVSVQSVEIDTPIARIYRDDKGIHAAGLIAKIGASEPVENVVSATRPTTQPAAPVAAATPAASGKIERPKNEIKLDRLTVSGVDMVIEDRTAVPHTVVPLKSLDVDVQGLSSQLPWNAKSVRFGVLVTSDKVPLPPRKGAKGEATTQPADGAYTEQRELFSQITATGKLGFVRRGDVAALDGWAKTAVNGFELLGVRGLAKQYGVTIGGGAFDDTNDIKFDPNGKIELRNRIVFTNLSMSEAANGPIGRLLKLPTPLDAAIGTLTDPDGSITLNVPVTLRNGAYNLGEIGFAAAGQVGAVLTTAIVSAPVKAVQGVGGLLGLGGKDKLPDPPVTLKFLPGYAGLGYDTRDALQTLRTQLKEDPVLELQLRHTLTDADVARTAARVNPPPAQCLVLAEQVRKQKADLEAQYATLAAEARGDFGAQAGTRAKQAVDALRDVSRRLAAADQSLDELYTLASSNATGLADRRTRTATLAIAQQRIDAIKTDLAAGDEAVAKRISYANPQFEPSPTGEGGDVTIVLVRKKQ